MTKPKTQSSGSLTRLVRCPVTRDRWPNWLLFADGSPAYLGYWPKKEPCQRTGNRPSDPMPGDVAGGLLGEVPDLLEKPKTNREAHEEAAGMGLCPQFFKISGIDPDAPFEPNAAPEPRGK